MRVQVTLELQRVRRTTILAQWPWFIDPGGPLVDLAPAVRQTIANISNSQDQFAWQISLQGHIPCLDAAALQSPLACVAHSDARVNRNRPFADIGKSDCRDSPC